MTRSSVWMFACVASVLIACVASLPIAAHAQERKRLDQPDGQGVIRVPPGEEVNYVAAIYSANPTRLLGGTPAVIIEIFLSNGLQARDAIDLAFIGDHAFGLGQDLQNSLNEAAVVVLTEEQWAALEDGAEIRVGDYSPFAGRACGKLDKSMRDNAQKWQGIRGNPPVYHRHYASDGVPPWQGKEKL